MRLSLVWTGMRPLLGTVVGVGIFGLPYAFAQVGFGLGLVALLFVAVLSLMALLLYADLLLVRKGHGRYLTVVGHDLSPLEQGLATIAYFGSHYGALLAYVLVGGSFAHEVFGPMLGGSLLLYQLVFWAIGSLIVGGGLSLLIKLQGILFPLIFLVVLVHSFFLIPHVSFSHLGTTRPENIAMSLGVLLFAFGGLSAVPDMRDVLNRNRTAIRASLVAGMVAISALYLSFSALVVGVMGEATAPAGITGLSAVIGPYAEGLGSLLGLGIVLSAYLAISVGMTNALIYDWRLRYVPAWGTVVVIPVLLLLAGATNFISVIGVTGGILSALLGLFLVVAYERARASHALSKNSLNIPRWLVGLTFCMYAGTILVTVSELFR